MEGLQKLLNDFSSWYWWVSVVVVSFAVNLASSFAKEPIDRWFARRSDSAAARREAELEKRERFVQLLLGDSRLITLAANRHLRLQLMAVMMLVLASSLVAVSVGARAGSDVIDLRYSVKALRPTSGLLALSFIAASVWSLEITRKSRLMLQEVERRIAKDTIERLVREASVQSGQAGQGEEEAGRVSGQ